MLERQDLPQWRKPTNKNYGQPIALLERYGMVAVQQERQASAGKDPGNTMATTGGEKTTEVTDQSVREVEKDTDCTKKTEMIPIALTPSGVLIM